MVSSTAGTNVVKQINMTLDTTPPKVVSAEMLSETTDKVVKQTLILTYDKKVIPTDTSGTIKASIVSNNGNIYNKNIPYTAAGNEKIITLTLTGQSFESGNYTFTLPSGFAIDMLDNRSKEQTVKTIKNAGSSAQLPAPVLILQDLSSPSKIKITFNNKLDMASVMNISNYAINGSIRPESATLVEQDETHAVIELTFASGVITDSAKYAITVSGIKGYNDSYNVMKPYTTEVVLTENNIPQIKASKLTGNSTVTLTLNKNVTGTAKFRMLTSGVSMDIVNPYIGGNTIVLNLPQSVNGSVIIMISENEIKDANNNKAELPGVIQVTQ